MVSVISVSKQLVSFLFFGVLLLNCFTGFGSYAQSLAADEVKTLQAIFTKLKNLNWEFNDNFCSEVGLFYSDNPYTDDFLRDIKCNCSHENGTVCHITSIQLKGQNLAGVLPAEFGDLTHLRQLDFSRNYINGSIPTSFGRLPTLVNLSLIGNRLSGAIPKEIGDIASLEELVLEDNQLNGTLHENLGNLSNLRRLVLSGNNFNGTIPESFGNLKNLTQFRISGTRISGKIPDFIGNWTKLNKLYMEGTSMEGPIPSSISLLTSLNELWISDLNVTTMKFPNLQILTNLNHLVLRNCLITDLIPEYIWEMARRNLRRLDLSFNRLSGKIPETIENVALEFMFLTNNSLSGEVPNWILNSRNYIDISYNKFSGSSDVNCDSQATANMVSIYSSLGSNSSRWCLTKDFPCFRKPQYYKLFINCGGNIMKYEENEYLEDKNTEGPSHFSSYSKEKWAYSSTGAYMGNISASYITSNSFLNVTGPAFYRTARIAPLSLKYYGLCLLNGSYKVKLHFAEIMFSNDQTFSSLGKRIFDVSIQGKLVLKDFNIMEVAGGAGIGISKEFNVTVNGSTLEIHLYWAGKGTNTIPQKGVYGPLISAIEVTPNFKVDIESNGGLGIGAIVGIVAASCVVLVFILVVLRMKGCLGGKELEDNGHRKDYINEEWKEDLDLPVFDLTTIANVTDNFSSNNMLGQGGFGPVYKGTLIEGQEIAVKRLSKNSGQGVEEFKNEIILIAKLQHRNLVKLLGCCIEGDEKLLIYEFMPNKSLDFFIFDQTRRKLLDWHKRINIIGGIARGLLYLHQDSRLRIIHRDLKTSNILLDTDMNPKISDFGMARMFWGDQTEENTHRVVGTYGYMSPEYAIDGLFSVKSDVFSFGVIVLEMVSGRKNRGFYHQGHNLNLLGHAWRLWIEEKPLELLDSVLSDSFSLSEVLRCIHVGLLCVQQQPEDRPNMSTVVLMLGSDGILLSPKEPGFYTERNPQPVADSSSSKNESCSANEMSFSELEAR